MGSSTADRMRAAFSCACQNWSTRYGGAHEGSGVHGGVLMQRSAELAPRYARWPGGLGRTASLPARSPVPAVSLG
jgi:hypothetical protein